MKAPRFLFGAAALAACALVSAVRLDAQSGATQDPDQQVDPGPIGTMVRHQLQTVTAAREAAPSDHGEPAGEGGKNCGIERWGVKTLSDPDADLVFKTKDATKATIEELITTPACAIPPGKQFPRFLGGSSPCKGSKQTVDRQETTVYQVHAVIKGYKLEADYDFHVVIADPADLKKTMIVEFPDPSCPGTKDSKYVGQMQTARDQFLKLIAPDNPGSYRLLPNPLHVVVTGVGFYDFSHNQTGVAPNARELHPVLGIALDN